MKRTKHYWTRTAWTIAALCMAGCLTGCSDNPVDTGGGESVRWRQVVLDGYPFSDYACGLTEDDRTFCWGSNHTGYTGSEFEEGSRTPLEMIDAPEFDALYAAWKYACGLTPTGDVYCWGSITSRENVDAPMTVPSPTRVETNVQFTDVAAATGFRCGLATDGTVYCWHWRDRTPVLLETEQRFSEISAGSAFMCGLSLENRIYCWGSNDAGQLGTGDGNSSDVPVPIAGNMEFTTVASGRERSCALDRSGKAWCWGSMVSFGGSPGRMGGLTPTELLDGGVYRDIDVGEGHVCALTPEGVAQCWGDNMQGSLGDGTTRSRATPAPITSDQTFTSISAGGFTACGITAEGEAFCWGSNSNGVLGNGESYGSGPVWEDFSPVAVRVANPGS